MLTLNEAGDILVGDLLAKLRELPEFEELASLFYFDVIRNLYLNLLEEDLFLIPYASIVSESTLLLM